MRRRVSGVLFATALLAAAPMAQLDRDAFEKELARAERTASLGRWPDAHAALVQLLEDHDGQTHALLRLAYVTSRLATYRFYMQHPLPEPGDVIGGELLAYDERRRELTLRYVPPQGGWEQRVPELPPQPSARVVKQPAPIAVPPDFDLVGEFVMHPMVLEPPYSIRIRGQEPKKTYGNHRQIDFGESATRRLRATLGTSHVSLGVSDLSEPGEGESAKGSFFSGGEGRYDIEIEATSNSVSISSGGRRVLRMKGLSSTGGRFSFTNIRGVEEIVLSGKSNLSWIQGEVDAQVSRALEEFREQDDGEQDLPVWIALLPEYEGQLGRAGFGESPGPDTVEANALRMELAELVGKGKARTAWSRLGEARAASGEGVALSEAFDAYHAALIQLAIGDDHAALDQAQRSCEASPGFAAAHTARAEALMALGHRRGAQAALQEAMVEMPTVPGLHEQLAILSLLEGQVPEARAVIDRAIAASVPPWELSELDMLLVKAEQGPAWPERFSHKSRHYEVSSDVDRAVCAAVASELESARATFTAALGGAGAFTERYRVHVFSGVSGYRDYIAGLFGDAPENTAGIYTPVLKQLLVWNLPAQEDLLETVRHEGFHQFLDRRISDAPRWFNEGLAEYFQQARIENGRLVPGDPPEVHLWALLDSGMAWAPLPTLFGMRAAQFQENATLHYAESWAIVAWLLDGGRDARARFDRFWEALESGPSHSEAYESAFGDTNTVLLQQAVRRHIEAMRED